MLAGVNICIMGKNTPWTFRRLKHLLPSTPDLLEYKYIDDFCQIFFESSTFINKQQDQIFRFREMPIG